MKLVGKTVTKVYPMDKKTMKALGWEDDWHKGRPVVIEFDDGTILYPASDGEGNDYGIFNWANGTACGLLCTDEKGAVKTVVLS